MDKERSIVGIIPSRYLSTRLPGKPLMDIGGKTMIRRVYEQAAKANMIAKVYVATDDQRIFDEVQQFGGLAIMTDASSVNGTERIFKAYDRIKEIDQGYNYVVNIQGDEPFIDPEEINQVCNLIVSRNCEIATLVSRIQDETELLNPNTVKVVRDSENNIIYFSRAAIPFVKGSDKKDWLKATTFYRHIGIYAFRSDVIKAIRELKPTTIEQLENLEQLRWLESGYPIASAETELNSISIDTPEDLQKAIEYADSKP